MLGTGIVARAFADDLHLVPGAALAAVGSRDLARARQFAQCFEVKHAHETAASLSRNDEVDVIYVATPHDRHEDDCLTCLAAGRAVLCEKPFTLNARQAKNVINLARSHRLFCMEAMWMRFHPLILQVRSLIQSGAIGPVRLLTADLGYPTAFDPENRFFNRSHGGGALLDRGVYLLSLAYFLLGAPQEVTGRATIGSTSVDEQMTTVLTYPGGTLAVLTASLRSRLSNTAVIIGSTGQIRIHEPFYAPHRISSVPINEPTGPVPAVSAAPRGWRSRIKQAPLLRHAFETVGRPVLDRMRRRESRSVHYSRGTGYQFEAAEVVRCLQAGQLESAIMPLDETLAIVQGMDTLRASWKLAYPCDEPR
jgi:predicted dehydrogenase